MEKRLESLKMNRLKIFQPQQEEVVKGGDNVGPKYGGPEKAQKYNQEEINMI